VRAYHVRGSPCGGRADAHLRRLDWLMPLERTWYSTIDGVYVFAGGDFAALAVVALVGYLASRRMAVEDGTVNSEHVGALG